MNITRVVMFSLFLLSTSALRAQVYGNFQYNQQAAQPVMQSRDAVSSAPIGSNSDVTLKVNGLMNITADNYIAVFNVVQVGETAENADQLLNSRIVTFKQRLREIGIDTTALTIDMLSFVPRYELQTEKRLFSRTYNEVPAGFELQKNVLVRYRSSAKLDDIVSAAAAAEIYDIVKVDYFIANIQRSLDSLRSACLAALKTKVRSFEAIGIKLDTQNKVMSEGYNTVYPPTRYTTYQAFSRPSLGAAIKKSAYQEQGKSPSVYYAPVNYDQYDLVINPIITEPVVQMSYTITVRYFIPQQEHNRYMLLTPNGDMRSINLR